MKLANIVFNMLFIIFVVGILCIPFHILFTTIWAHKLLFLLIVAAIATIIHIVNAFRQDGYWDDTSRFVCKLHGRVFKADRRRSRIFHKNHAAKPGSKMNTNFYNNKF